MADRIGIELSPFACRIVELPALPLGRPRLDAAVPSLTLLPRSGPATTEHFASLRGRTASVVLWGLHSDHRQVVVADGSYDRVRAEARAAARAAGVPVHGTLSDVAPAGPVDPNTKRRVVVLATAPTGEVTAALRPLLEAGLKIQSVRTPASALVSLARLRGSVSSGGLEAYVAIGETTTAVALVQGGLIRFARDFGWGSRDDASRYHEETSAEEIGAKLAADLSGFVDACGSHISTLERVVVTGAVSELRSIAIRLTGEFDVEVEPLDYAGGLEIDGLAATIDMTNGRYADVWLAWAAAADDKPLIDLYRDRRFFFRRQIVARAAVAAGVALGVGVGWTVAYRMSSSLDLFTGVARQSVPVAAVQPRPAPLPGQAGAPSALPSMAPGPISPAAVAPPPVASAPSAQSAPEPLPFAPPPQPAAPPVRLQPPAAVSLVPVPPMPPPVPRLESPPAVAVVSSVPRPRPSTAQPPPQPPPRAAAVPLPATAQAASQTAPTPPAQPQAAALPFDAVLGTILHGPDRKLAVVDGRIVQVGDDVRGAVVVEITPNAVLLRDQQGRMRRLTLGSANR